MSRGLNSCILLGLIAGTSACSPASLEELKELPISYSASSRTMGEVHADFCSLDPQTVKPILKVIFVVDQSGSNQVNPGPAPGSDTTGSRRFLPIIDFASTIVANDPTVYMALLSFNTAIVNSYPGSPTSPPPFFTNNTAAFATEINSVMTQNTSVTPAIPQDQGDTDFVATLSALSKLIQADMAANCQPNPAQQIIYNAMLVSDGFPEIGGVTQDPTAILNAVSQYVTIPPQYASCVSEIVLNTGLYFNPPSSTWTLPPSSGAPCATDLSALGLTSAESLMSTMAQTGHGSCSLFPNDISYGALAAPQREIKYTLRDVMVKNMNAVWENGVFKYDTDMDGLSDDLEGTLGSKPFLKDSDKNGVSDYVEYQVFGTPCRAADCDQAGANAFQLNLCRELNPSIAPDGSVTYPDSDVDGLNDCEEKLLLSDATQFSTNGSWVPDFMMLIYGMNLTGLPSELQLTPQMDGLTNYQKIKGGAPTNLPITQLPGYSPMQYALQLTSQTSLQECYHVDVTNILVTNPNDMMRIYITDGSLAVDTRRYLRSVDQQLSNYSLTLSPSDFPAQ